MKAIIPVAGLGTRLRPLTHTAPKVMLHVAGKPIVGHILDKLLDLKFTELTLIIGYMGEMVQEYVEKEYPNLKVNYVQQEERKGLGHAIHLTEQYHQDDEPVLIILGDTIFEADLETVIKTGESAIGVKEVEDPRRFGIVELENDRISKLVEKPSEPKTNLAIVGIYYIKNSPLLFSSLQEIIDKKITTKNEYQLTDALQIMLDKGEKMNYFQINSWFDCGKPETLLDTNQVLLEKSDASYFNETKMKKTVIIPPVFVEKTVRIENSVIGPNVSIAAGSKIKGAMIRNSIINKQASIKNIILEDSIVGDNAQVTGQAHKLTIGDSSAMDFR